MNEVVNERGAKFVNEYVERTMNNKNATMLIRCQPGEYLFCGNETFMT
jgi:hypothetical protein